MKRSNELTTNSNSNNEPHTKKQVAEIPEVIPEVIPDCKVTNEFKFDLANLRTDYKGKQNRHFYIVEFKNGKLCFFYETTATSNENGIPAGTVFEFIGVSNKPMQIRPIAQPEGKKGTEHRVVVVGPGSIVKVNDGLEHTYASWQAELFFKILVKGNSILSYEDLSNLHTLTRNFSSWPCFQYSAFIGGGWWETRGPFQRFVLNHDYDALTNEKIVPRPSEFSVNIDEIKQTVELRLLPNKDFILKDEFPELISSDEVRDGHVVKKYLNILIIIERIKSSNLKTTSDKSKSIDQMIKDIVSLFPDDESVMQKILGQSESKNLLSQSKNLLSLFRSLLPPHSYDEIDGDGSQTPIPFDEIGGGRPKTRKKRRTKRRTRKSKKSKKSRKSRKRKL